MSVSKEQCALVTSSLLSYHNQLRRLDGLVHHLIYLLGKLQLGTLDYVDVRLRHRMLCHKNRAAVLEGLDGSLVGIDLLGDRDDIFLIKGNQRTEHGLSLIHI